MEESDVIVDNDLPDFEAWFIKRYGPAYTAEQAKANPLGWHTWMTKHVASKAAWLACKMQAQEASADISKVLHDSYVDLQTSRHVIQHMSFAGHSEAMATLGKLIKLAAR